MKKLLISMGWLDRNGKFDFVEFIVDIVITSAIATVIYTILHWSIL